MSRCVESLDMMTFADKEVGVCYKCFPVMILKRTFILRTEGTIFPLSPSKVTFLSNLSPKCCEAGNVV